MLSKELAVKQARSLAVTHDLHGLVSELNRVKILSDKEFIAECNTTVWGGNETDYSWTEAKKAIPAKIIGIAEEQGVTLSIVPIVTIRIENTEGVNETFVGTPTFAESKNGWFLTDARRQIRLDIKVI